MPPGLTFRERCGYAVHLAKALTQQHHTALAPILARHIPHDAFVFDIGAHAGQFAKLFARLAPDGRVYAFEPGAYARSILAQVVRWRLLRNVEIVPFGLSDGLGTAMLTIPVKRRGDLGFGLSHLGAAGARLAHAEAVRLTTLDQFAADQNLIRLDFIKADIEGWEIRMLRGSRETLARWRPSLLLELHTGHLERAGTAPAEAWALLGPLGYRAQRLRGDGSLAPAAEFTGDGDYLFAVSPSRE
jgi:FkbM family methyltransferase